MPISFHNEQGVPPEVSAEHGRAARSAVTTMPEKNTCREKSFQSTKSGAGEQFLLLDFRAAAHPKGVFFSQTPVSDRDGARSADPGGRRGRSRDVRKGG